MSSGLRTISLCNTPKCDVEIHSIPCKIHYNGFANIEEFFKPSKVEGENDLTASFRGFPLNGKVVELPENYSGVLFKSDEEGNLSSEKHFKSITYWEWDKKPTKNDAFISALDWLSLSSQMHDPVEEDT